MLRPDLAVTLGSAVDTWATVGVAVGTIGTVVYALFRDVFMAPRRRPKLELRFDGIGNDQVVVGTPRGTTAAQVRLRVANGAGRDTADDVVVMVTEVRRLEDPTQAVAGVTPVGLPLAWSGSSPPLTVGSVHPGSERHIDLLHVDCPPGAELDVGPRASKPAALQLDLALRPAGGQDNLDPGKHEIAVEVRARNADATCYVIPVHWDGQRFDQVALWDHLRVETPRRVR